MEIEEFFRNYFLTCGTTRDNFIFENCPKEFVDLAAGLLSQSNNDTKSCVVVFTSNDEQRLNETINKCNNEVQRKILCRDYVTAKIIKSLLVDADGLEEDLSLAEEIVNAFDNCDYEKAKQLHASAFMPYEVAQFKRDLGPFEVNIMMIDTQSKDMQQAINNFISAREPYSIKLFTTNYQLPSYYDQMGNLMQSPHDYMTRDINQYIIKAEQNEI